jgi:predicted nucleic acid-binding protein
MLVIADTSPLHYLVLIEQTDILPSLFGRVIIPPMVAEELQRFRTPDPVRAWIGSPPAWLEMRVPQQPLITVTLRLGAGEREALSLAQELRPDLLLLDDLEAREEAEHRDFAVMGTLGVLELAAERGLLDFPAAITKLKATSFHMPVQLVQDMLARDAARKRPL